MILNGKEIENTSNKFGLPDFCYAKNNMTGETIQIKYGESGYYRLADNYRSIDPMILNEKIGVSFEQMQAMSVGSMFGWNVAGVNPDRYKKDEVFITGTNVNSEHKSGFGNRAKAKSR